MLKYVIEEEEMNKVVNVILSSNFHKTCLKIHRDSKINCPVDTGRLRSSLKIDFLSDGEAELTSNVVYAPRVEYGFIGYDKLGRFYNQSPSFFIHNAIVKNINELSKSE